MQPQKKQDDGKSKKQPEDSKCQQELSAVTKELERLKEMAGRAQADLQNARERMRREAQEVRAFALEAFAHLPEELKNHDWVKGLQAMEQAFIKELSDVGLQQIASLGKPVNPAYHEVLQAGPGEKDVITEVFEEGYLLREKVLRPAKVKVGDGTENAH
ncbi:MAG: Protein GrpE [Candidatus Peribacteria bacterium GW2011_GWC2_54_8]|nr:MAG: Protein GrpE [Candidatus Peribacteria bacterium GW2011_GWC2_54_8]